MPREFKIIAKKRTAPRPPIILNPRRIGISAMAAAEFQIAARIAEQIGDTDFAPMFDAVYRHVPRDIAIIIAAYHGLNVPRGRTILHFPRKYISYITRNHLRDHIAYLIAHAPRTLTEIAEMIDRVIVGEEWPQQYIYRGRHIVDAQLAAAIVAEAGSAVRVCVVLRNFITHNRSTLADDFHNAAEIAAAADRVYGSGHIYGVLNRALRLSPDEHYFRTCAGNLRALATWMRVGRFPWAASVIVLYDTYSVSIGTVNPELVLLFFAIAAAKKNIAAPRLFRRGPDSQCAGDTQLQFGGGGTFATTRRATHCAIQSM